MTILHRMIALFNSLDETSIYRNVLACMIVNLSRIPDLSLEETAELCGSSTITVTRLMKKLDCVSFPVFRGQLRETTDTYIKHNRSLPIAVYNENAPMKSYIDFIDNIMHDMLTRVTSEQLEKACRMLDDAKDVHIYDPYPFSQSKKLLQVDLAYREKLSFVPRDAHSMKGDAETLTGNSLLIISLISSLPNYAVSLRIAREANEKGIPMLILTSTSTPGCSELSDCVLTFEGTDSAADNLFIDLLINIIGLIYRKLYIDPTF